MGLQSVHGKRLALEVDDQPRVEVAVEPEFSPTLQIAAQAAGRSAAQRGGTGLPNDNLIILDRHFAKAHSASRHRRAARGAQLSQQTLLADAKPFAQEGKSERRKAPGALFGAGLGERAYLFP